MGMQSGERGSELASMGGAGHSRGGEVSVLGSNGEAGDGAEKSGEPGRRGRPGWG